MMRRPSNTLRRMAGQLSEGTTAGGGVGSQLIQLVM